MYSILKYNVKCGKIFKLFDKCKEEAYNKNSKEKFINQKI